MHVKNEEECYIKKGPWKAEEDEVLLNHVNKYGPRDWSSIRSKGLLHRTGKSCRLRWVNKLQPNLKNGCKFSVEEERVVIELQAEIGNKWAKIASYLQGRTDNDVKNFWSSRQKRLARILHTTTCTSKSQKNKTKVSEVQDGFTLEASKLSSSMEGESSSIMSQQSYSLSFNQNSEFIKMVPLPSSDINHAEQEFITPFESYKNTEQISFPQVPELKTDITFSMESQDLLARIDEPNFIDVFDPIHASSEYEIGVELPIGLPFFEPLSGNSGIGTRDRVENSKNSDSFFDDFPVDIFDDMEQPTSPSKL
ncbi:hypothetical protein TanjilG_16257 [Lupinus angustifolius]|uniref:Uncharacterized protein n=1 Tax=Lupinus angustifolius TaxID=3871 RepID=A0A1J7GKI3_LUPAN|nr:PREDICTED: myb-related protein 340 [Lupinus angustifolius]OIW01008.1 hypothetical protein TanjilG_16257 [Lupinus angustifolius]